MKRCIDQYGPLVWSIVCRRISDEMMQKKHVRKFSPKFGKKAGSYDPEASPGIDFHWNDRPPPIDRLATQNKAGFPLLTELDSVPEVLPLLHSLELAWTGSFFEALEKPKKTRDLFSLHFVQGMTHEEIVKKPACLLGTVKTRLRQGLIDARKLLKEFTKTEVSEV